MIASPADHSNKWILVNAVAHSSKCDSVLESFWAQSDAAVMISAFFTLRREVSDSESDISWAIFHPISGRRLRRWEGSDRLPERLSDFLEQYGESPAPSTPRAQPNNIIQSARAICGDSYSRSPMTPPCKPTGVPSPVSAPASRR
eukprot:NODE_4228_length_842_cov_10.654477_g3902_i0.p1 GENE.NODE_4228_length_842_cov_10.654477_g3902_i0~~NODE_4228_length_842_cov_10.654477_g3902_i0.p1  ORF type:complete len:145 (-),score=11.11 NODE_4228_length_842_cov_10.654477_g3902_i0:284-718(-)